MSISESEPLFSCCGCRDDYSWPASDLRVYANELWCEPCWGETDMAHDGVHWAELTAFVPKQDAQIERLTKERDELAASHARLREVLFNSLCCLTDDDRYSDDAEISKVTSDTYTILEETPAQSVAHYKAEGLQMAATECRYHYRYGSTTDCCNNAITECAEAIEAKAKEIADDSK